jgi:hypothetical protein
MSSAVVVHDGGPDAVVVVEPGAVDAVVVDAVPAEVDVVGAAVCFDLELLHDARASNATRTHSERMGRRMTCPIGA